MEVFIERIEMRCTTRKHIQMGKGKQKNLSGCFHTPHPAPEIAVLQAPGRERPPQTSIAAMLKNKSKNRCRGKSENESEIRELIFKENGPLGPAQQMWGNVGIIRNNVF